MYVSAYLLSPPSHDRVILVTQLVLVYLLHFTYLALPILAVPVNVTVDDTNGDPRTGAQFLYSPLNRWNVGQNCTSCSAHVNASLAYMHTWHDVSSVNFFIFLLLTQTW